MATATYDEVGAIMAYEQGELDSDATLELFQHLVDNGLVWQLQGSYGRTAQHLIDTGAIRLQSFSKRESTK